MRTEGKKPQQQQNTPSKQMKKKSANPTATKPTSQPTKRNAKPVETKYPVTNFETLPGWHGVCQAWLLMIWQPFGTILRQVTHHHKLYCSKVHNFQQIF